MTRKAKLERSGPVRLRYVGAPVPPGSALPLPEGWPARDHDEPDADVAARKLRSGAYVSLLDSEAEQEPEAPAAPDTMMEV